MSESDATGLDVKVHEGFGAELRRKYLNVFKDLDVNCDGVISQADFTIMAERLGKGVSGDAQAFIVKGMNDTWEVLRESADTNKSQKVNRDEFVVHMANLIKGCEKFADFPPYWDKIVRNLTGRLCDESGIVNEDRYIACAMDLRWWVKDKKVFVDHWKRVTDGKLTCSKEHLFHTLIEGWALSNSPDAKGFLPEP